MKFGAKVGINTNGFYNPFGGWRFPTNYGKYEKKCLTIKKNQIDGIHNLS